MDSNEVRCDEKLCVDLIMKTIISIMDMNVMLDYIYSLSWIVARHRIKVLDGQQLQCLSTPRQGKFGNLLPKSKPG